MVQKRSFFQARELSAVMLQQFSTSVSQELALAQHNFSTELCASLKELAQKIQKNFHDIQALILANCDAEMSYIPILKAHATNVVDFNKYTAAADALLQSVKPKAVRAVKRKADQLEGQGCMVFMLTCANALMPKVLLGLFDPAYIPITHHLQERPQHSPRVNRLSAHKCFLQLLSFRLSFMIVLR